MRQHKPAPSREGKGEKRKAAVQNNGGSQSPYAEKEAEKGRGPRQTRAMDGKGGVGKEGVGAAKERDGKTEIKGRGGLEGKECALAGKNRGGIKEAAATEATRLIDLAKVMWPADKELAKRYVSIARKMAMRHRVHLDPKSFCRKCGVPFVAGTLKVRQDRATKTVLYACRDCNSARRIPYRKNNPCPSQKGENRQPGSKKPVRQKNTVM